MNAVMHSDNVSQRYHAPRNALDPSLGEDKL
ncbi:hypothetical protein T4A_14399 [Trichinella pseudospiralis]|uniref:Uncharacterized protein n=1 Tax=Trichinella pseudospiralis TaxID=6337 RepID=A0A0V1DXX3_TRIPS|nr:hypothetical protein T4A_14399 [Trichinella pseudospiralis]